MSSAVRRPITRYTRALHGALRPIAEQAAEAVSVLRRLAVAHG
ncbi:hypothetical protein BURMUCGD2M_5730 [Burkholderia multivorans CGD2M]|uniref:Uncharacterized protein n=1 Tax=Burkholderia multivorans CGD2 TaxID=513052 RepID=B9BKY2_9BURK|nr:hypothetical protein BURMUCGD2_5740 [Burkholderia multivorans CGD2]EEE16285.1 hypothetical protein BURMUCGD2M_5730 [Burkholderia multivorans CGD2M]